MLLLHHLHAPDIKLNWGARPYKQREVMKPFSGYAQLPNWQPQITIEMGLTKFNNRGIAEQSPQLGPFVILAIDIK